MGSFPWAVRWTLDCEGESSTDTLRGVGWQDEWAAMLTACAERALITASADPREHKGLAWSSLGQTNITKRASGYAERCASKAAGVRARPHQRTSRLAR